MQSRRKFIQFVPFLGLVPPLIFSKGRLEGPLVISTWNNMNANQLCFSHLNRGGALLDAIEKAVNSVESDPQDQSVGYGGRPDRTGIVTLDASIMDHLGNAGSVVFLKDIEHPVSVARKVMEDTDHVMLAGKGAQDFARSNGFKKKKLLTPESKAQYKKWKKHKRYAPKPNIEMHDTIGLLAMNKQGDLSGACSTSGLAYKMHGRVGDSPVIGAGLFVDNEIGAATATGMGEEVLKTCGSFLVVELMRQGLDPQEACKEAVLRLLKSKKSEDVQVGYIAMNKHGEYGAYSLKSGFVFSIKSSTQELVIEADSYYP